MTELTSISQGDETPPEFEPSEKPLRGYWLEEPRAKAVFKRRAMNQKSYRKLKPFKDELKKNKDAAIKNYTITAEDEGMNLQELIERLTLPFEVEYRRKALGK